MAELQDVLPPGWDCKYDPKTGRHYFVNHYTKISTWEDPRYRHRQLMGTPVHHSSGMPIEHIPMQDLSRGSPLSVRAARIREQDTSLSAPPDPEQSVTKISGMFPTVSDTHIRILLKKYMKSLFPGAEETVILDILGNNDNNINNASEALKTMGYEKKSSKPTPKVETPKKEEPKPEETPPVRKLKSLQEKKQMKQKLQEKYKNVEEQVITIALESSDFSEDRAKQILDFMVQEQEEESKKNSVTKDDEEKDEDEMDALRRIEMKTTAAVPNSQSRQSLKVEIIENNKCRRSKEKKHSNRMNESTYNENNSEYRSSYISKPIGPNSSMVQGSNDNLLLEDYVTWHGANPSLCQGSKALPKGPNRSLLIPRTYQPHGPNSDMRKGPACGLAKGSIFSQLKSVVVGESRGK